MHGNKLTVIFASLSAILLVVTIILWTGQDNTPPSIHFTDSDVVYFSDMDKTLLFQGVSAYDEEDGDVTSQLVIEKIVSSVDGKTVAVTYAVGDSKHNFSKATRIFPQEEIMKVEDVEKEANSYDAVTEIGLEGMEELDPERPVLELESEDVTTEVGTRVVWSDIIKTLSDEEDDYDTLYRKLVLSGEYDEKIAGDYEVVLWTQNSRGKQSKACKLTIHVVEAAE